jgi:quercetin dioxygenase-like cupin family protein
MPTRKSENLIKLESLITGNADPAKVCYEGGTEGFGLYFGADAAVVRSFLKAGTVFPPHVHSATEVVVVLSGIFHSSTAILTCVTPVAGVIVFQPGVSHSHVAETDCWVVGITIPSDEGYPHD